MSETTIAEQPQRDSPAVGRAAEPITTPAESISAPVAPPARAPLTLPTRLRFIAANLGTFLLALVLSLFIWVAAVNEQNPPREDLYPLDIPIELINRPPSLVLTQPFERTARVRIRAPQSSWERLQPNSIHAFVDLKDATATVRDYDVQVTFSDPDIVILAKDPSRVTLRLEELREKNVRVQVNVNGDAPGGFSLGAAQVTPEIVQVSGAQSRVDQIVAVDASVQLRADKSTIEREVKLVARDAQGNAIPESDVRLTPATVTVKVPIEQKFGFKDVVVKVVTKGSVASGYWISNISVEPNIVTIAGTPANKLDEIGGFIATEPIDVKDAKATVQRPAILALPAGVAPVSTQNVFVTIDVSATSGGQTVQRPVTIQGLDRSLKAKASPESVDIILAGPLPDLQALKLDDVKVILDLSNKTPGKYKITPTVEKPNSLKVESIVPDTIEVVISK